MHISDKEPGHTCTSKVEFCSNVSVVQATGHSNAWLGWIGTSTLGSARVINVEISLVMSSLSLI